MSPTRTQIAKWFEKAKAKKDGVYSDAPYLYSVKGGQLIYIGDKVSGEVIEYYGNFNVHIGIAKPWELKKVMKRMTDKHERK